MTAEVARFKEFWPHYLAAHRDPRTRALHYLGTTGGLLLAAGFLASGDWRLLAAAPVAGYGFAWIGHAVFERNRPATFGRPLWSLWGDFYMLSLFAVGRLGPELRRLETLR